MSSCLPFINVTSTHGPEGGGVDILLLNVAVATFDTGLVWPSSSVAVRAKLYEKDSTSGMSATTITKVSVDPKGLGEVRFPSRILD